MTDTRRRVKVYTLNEDRQWDDRGTGHVSYSYVERLKGMTLLVRAEQDSSVLLESKILPDTAYQKQQETLIVWSETDATENESTDLALSFQEKAGCDEIWEQICQVQGKDPSVNITQDIVDDGEEDDRIDGSSDIGAVSTEPVELPPCELGRITDISEVFTSCLSSLPRREKLAIAVESEEYLTKLLNLFRMCEDMEHIEGLHRLHEIFKTLFLLNKNSLFEIMLDEKHIMDVVGCLEYDPSLPEATKHREYLLNKAKFREVLTINNEKLKKKIHQTFRVQYIQEVILPTPTVFEENMLSTLNSFIFFNKVEIVNMIQEDENFLRDLFSQLLDGSIQEDRRIELAGFLRELCSYSQTLQISKRYEFLRALADLGVLPVVESLLQTDNLMLKQLAVDVFAHVVEHNPSMVREYAHREMEESRNNSMKTNGKDSENDVLLINLVIEQMICDPDPELSGAMQLMSLVRILLDPENMMASKNEKTEFLSFFYSNCMHVLMAPLLSSTSGDKPAKDDYQNAHLLSIILELITFSVEHHTYQVKNYILNKDLLRRILVLLKSRHTFLALAALRFMRKIISMMDEFYHRYIIKGNLFQPVVDSLFKSGKRYNLLNSAALEMFEFIRSEDIKSLINHIAEKHMDILLKINYVSTFNGIHQRYEQQKDRENHRLGTGLENSYIQSRFRRDARTMEEEEEMWFEGDDDGDDDLIANLGNRNPKINIDKILEDKPKEETENKIQPVFMDSQVFEQEDKDKPTPDSTTDTPTEKTSVPLVNGNGKIKESTNGKDDSNPVVTVKSGVIGLVDYSDDESEEDDENTDDKMKDTTIKMDEAVKTSESLVGNDHEPARKKPRMSEITKSN